MPPHLSKEVMILSIRIYKSLETDGFSSVCFLFFQKIFVRKPTKSFATEIDLVFPTKSWTNFLYGEFDPGSERTLAAWIRHASRTHHLAFSNDEWRKGE